MHVSTLALSFVLPPSHTTNAMGFIGFVIHLSEVAPFNYISKSTRLSPDNLQQPPAHCWHAHLRIHRISLTKVA